jgi:hypothetical protein
VGPGTAGLAGLAGAHPMRHKFLGIGDQGHRRRGRWHRDRRPACCALRRSWLFFWALPERNKVPRSSITHRQEVDRFNLPWTSEIALGESAGTGGATPLTCSWRLQCLRIVWPVAISDSPSIWSARTCDSRCPRGS